MGPPGSGKGTLAQLCADRLDWATLSTGALFRKHISEQTELGKQVDFIIKSGKLVPDELVTAMVDSWLSNLKNEISSIILDGFPRTVKQVRLLKDLLSEKYPDIGLRIIRLNISDDAVIRRLSGRLLCKNKDCQMIYSTVAGSEGLAPKSDMICDKCGSPLEVRKDDQPGVIRDRLAVYHQNDIAPVFVEAGYSIENIDAHKSLEEIFEDFERLL